MKTVHHMLLAIALLLSCAACTNPETPAGFEGYVYHVPIMFGKMDFRRSMKGPASTGMAWRLYVENVDMRKKSHLESFDLLTSDNLSVSFKSTTRIKPKDGFVQEIVEKWGGKHWYEWNVKEPLRTAVRLEVIGVSATDIQLRTQEVKKRIYNRLVADYKDSPFTIESVDIGEIHFPEELTAAIQQKIAKKQELRRQAFVLKKAKKEAAIRVLEALKVAKQQRIISSTLDPLYVQRKAVQVYRGLAKSKNKTVMMLPTNGMATGMPLVMASGRRKVLSAADEKLLAEMEARYMKLASQPESTSKKDADDSADLKTPSSVSPAKAPASLSPEGHKPKGAETNGATPGAPDPKTETKAPSK